MKTRFVLAACMLLSSASGSFATTIFSFNPTGTLSNLRFLRSTANPTTAGLISARPGITSATWLPVSFAFTNPQLNNALGTFDALMLFEASATGAAQSIAGVVTVQPGVAGTLSFKTINDMTVGQTFYGAGANLFSINLLSGGAISGLGSSGSLIASENGSAVFGAPTSDFLNISGAANQELSMSLNGITSALAFVQGQALSSFNATARGSYAADGDFSATAVIPEPATWAMLMTGFGMVGSLARRRRNVVAA